MRKSSAIMSVAALVVALPLLGPRPGRAEEIAPEYRKAIDKGLDWLAKAQHRDGHWDAVGGQYPVAMTALGGIAILMEGSTIRDGKYADNVLRATNWLTGCAQRSGL